MKKLILLLGILSMGFQCENHYDPIVNEGVWYVKNATDGTLTIKRPEYNTLRSYEIAPGATQWLYSHEYDIWKMPGFESLASLWDGLAEEDIAFEVLSGDGTPAAKWTYSDKDMSGRQFFNESSWIYSQSEGDRVDEIRGMWVFTIVKEDLQ